MDKFDLIVIGSGPGGEKAAVKAAYFKHKVALIEAAPQVGGATLNEGLPAKVLKETSLYISGKIGESYGVIHQDHLLSIGNFLNRAFQLSKEYSNEVKQNLKHHGVYVFHGEAAFVDANTVHILGERELSIYGDKIIVAVGTRPLENLQGIPIDGKRIHNAQTILNITQIPKSICIVGMGISGCEYGSIFSSLGTKVFFVNRHKEVLSLFDHELTRLFMQELQDREVEFLLEDEVISLKYVDAKGLEVTLRSGDILHVELLICAAGRVGNTKDLNLENIGVKIDERGKIPCNEHYQTNIENIYAIGDVNGKGQLASIAMDQGRAAVSHMFRDTGIQETQDSAPFGMYTTPEVAAVGYKESELDELKMEYAVGYSYYSDIPRGQLTGSKGMMKIIFLKSDLVIVGVHIIGTFATELIHYAVNLVNEKKTIRFLANELFNFPTLHELYKYAAYDGLSLITGYKMKKSKRREIL